MPRIDQKRSGESGSRIHAVKLNAKAVRRYRHATATPFWPLWHGYARNALEYLYVDVSAEWDIQRRVLMFVYASVGLFSMADASVVCDQAVYSLHMTCHIPFPPPPGRHRPHERIHQLDGGCAPVY